MNVLVDASNEGYDVVTKVMRTSRSQKEKWGFVVVVKEVNRSEIWEGVDK